MKLSVAFVAAALAASASAHTSLQWFWPEGTMATSVQNCVRQAPNNSPVEDVTSPNIACNVNGNVPAAAVCNVRAGSTVKIEWHHVSREQKSGDDPIAASHHGPISIYLAKVDDAKTTNVNGLEWFKIQEEGLNNGVWAVDRLIDIGTGEWDVRLPANLPNGQYLLRGEIIALHAAGNYPGAQFYIGCVQINVTGGSGNAQFSPRVRFPGAYDGNHPGIKINIWQGVSNYQIPGPAVATAGGSGGSPPPATTQAPPPVTTQAPPPVTTQAPPPSGPAVGKWGQCGGIGYSGSTTCEAGSTCVKLNDYYSQCQ